MAEDRMLNDEILLGLIKANSGGGGGGTTDYEDLDNLPEINSVELKGNKSLSDLGIASASDLAAKQDTLTFDDTPTDNSNNPVKSNGIYDALALKQDATDNSLDTTAKTIVGAINEHEGDISSLKSGLTNLDNEVNGDATTYPYADVITIPDAIPANLADCNVKIEPDQDLHGYDHPWVGGAGIQKLHLDIDTIKSLNISGTWTGNSYEHRGIVYECSVDSYGSILSIKSSGTNNTGDVSVLKLNELETQTFKAGTYTFGIPSSNYSGAVRYRVNDGSWFAVKDTEVSKVYENDFTCIIQIAINTGETVTNLMWYPMFCLSSEYDGNFYPYSNICPISGHTEVDVQRDGVNLIDVSNLEVGGSNADGSDINVQNRIRTKNNIAVFPNTNYTVNGEVTESSIANALYFFDKNGDFISSLGWNTDLPKTFKTPDNCYQLRATFKKTNETNVIVDDFEELQLELGSTATPYEPYQGKTYTIALGDTIYGGTVDFDSGVMTVDRGIVDFDGSDVWTISQTTGRYIYAVSDGKLGSGAYVYTKTSHYPYDSYGASGDKDVYWCDNQTSALRIIFNTSFTAKADWLSYLTTQNTDGTPLQICYPLATPFTIQLTPQQIQLLKGQNTLTASTGQISVTANGVSGAIGAVQEQVNELAGKIGENQIYSDTPVQIGTVGDKPLYRLFVTFETPISSVDNAYTSTGINSEDIELILRGDGINADGTYYGHLAFDPTFNEHQAIGVKGTANIKYAVIEYI